MAKTGLDDLPRDIASSLDRHHFTAPCNHVPVTLSDICSNLFYTVELSV